MSYNGGKNISSVMAAIPSSIQTWLKAPFDASTRKRVQELWESSPHDLLKHFQREILFGTGGIRELMDVGPGFLNRYTIARISQGLAEHLLQQHPSPLVVVGYDGRHHSKEFAEQTASTLSALGISVKLFPTVSPTPLVSFAARHFHAHAAVMITASHNPPEYNGYKVYNDYGGQVVPPDDQNIQQHISHLTDYTQIKLDQANPSLIEAIDDDTIDQAYLMSIAPLQRGKKSVHESLRITYSNFHGTGIRLVPKALRAGGFKAIDLVEPQLAIDGDFPHAKNPNPEYIPSLRLGVKQMLDNGSDLFLATDPDGDRLAIAVPHHGKPFYFTGNQVASICTAHLCEKGPPTSFKDTPGFVTTIVSSPLISHIANQHGYPCELVLTGFKYIAQVIEKWRKEQGPVQFLFGAEESCGYLLGQHARDKDGMIAACLIAEIAAELKSQGKTLVDYLEEIYRQYGLFIEHTHTLSFPMEKLDQIPLIMRKLRDRPPSVLCSLKMVRVDDYEKGETCVIATQQTSPLTLPTSDVLTFYTENGWRFIIRPSGTEPKIKIYASFHTEFTPHSVEKVSSEVEKMSRAVAEELVGL